MRALVQLLLALRQLWNMRAELSILVPAGSPGRGHQVLLAVVLQGGHLDLDGHLHLAQVRGIVAGLDGPSGALLLVSRGTVAVSWAALGDVVGVTALDQLLLVEGGHQVRAVHADAGGAQTELGSIVGNRAVGQLGGLALGRVVPVKARPNNLADAELKLFTITL